MGDRVGERLGNYRLTQLLGKGGFAEVYLGEHIHLNSLVAVKILRTQLVQQEQERFLQEARLIASLDHPAIIRVLDFAVEQDTAFLVMNYAPHGTLRQRQLKGTFLPLELVVSYSKQVAAALDYAHQRKIIHRDIKPENMLLDANDKVLLSDFGIALVASSSSIQSTKDAAGTAIYMAPEQIMGKPRPASDQYSLGIVIYEWLCGMPPFQGTFPELCAQHLYAPPPTLRKKNPQVSQMLEQVVMTALAKEPHQRFANVQAFANALEQACQQTIILTSSTPPLLPEVTGSQASTFVQTPPQESESTTAQHISFFLTQPVENLASGQEVSHQSSVEASQNERITPILSPFATKPLTQTTFSVPNSPASYSGGGPYTRQHGQDVDPIYSHKPVHPTAPPFRKKAIIIGTLITIFVLLFGSLAFEWQQINAANGKAPILTNVTSGKGTPITQSTQGALGNGTATHSTQKILTPNATASVALGATATQMPTTASTTTATKPPTATPTTIPSTLTVSPSTLFNNLYKCGWDTHGGNGYLGACPLVVSNSAQTKRTLSWSVSATPATVSLDHASGTLAPGQSATISVNAQGQNCPLNIMLTFQSTDNTVQIPFGCTEIYINPAMTSLDSTNCTHNVDWTCVIQVQAPTGNSTTTSWSVETANNATSGPLAGVTFSQAQGTLAPGASTQVTMTVASTSCPESGTITFYVPGSIPGADLLDWSC